MYTPIKTRTLIVIFIGLCVAVGGGLAVGSNMVVLPERLYEAFPFLRAEEMEEPSLGGSTAVIETPAPVEEIAEPAVTPLPAAPSSSQPVSTPEAPIIDEKNVPVETVPSTPTSEPTTSTTPNSSSAAPTTSVAPISPEVVAPPVVPTPSPVSETPTSTPSPIVEEPVVVPDTNEKDTPESICIQMGLEWDGNLCVAPQVPEEVVAPEGMICTVVDAVEGTVSCIIPETDEFVAVP